MRGPRVVLWGSLGGLQFGSPSDLERARVTGRPMTAAMRSLTTSAADAAFTFEQVARALRSGLLR